MHVSHITSQDALQAYPWLYSSYQTLSQWHDEKRLPHALLIEAKSGLGSRLLINAWIKKLLCHQQGHFACHQCQACQWFDKGHHPDVQTITIEEGKKNISIDQIRDLIKQLQETAHQSQGWRIAFIQEANHLSISAYNALLKILEEPGNNIHIILLAEYRKRIPATLLSRCQMLPIQALPKEENRSWISQQLPDSPIEDIELAVLLSNNSPLQAVDYLKNNKLSDIKQFMVCLADIANEKKQTTDFVEDYLQNELFKLLQWWLFVVSSLLKHCLQAEALPKILLPNYQELAELTSERLLFEMRDKLLEFMYYLETGVAVNQQMQFDDLARQWRQLFLQTSKLRNTDSQNK